MTISVKEFRELVISTLGDRYDVSAMSGYAFKVVVKARRMAYDVSASYDPETGFWSMYDVYRGNTIRHAVDAVDAALKQRG